MKNLIQRLGAIALLSTFLGGCAVYADGPYATYATDSYSTGYGATYGTNYGYGGGYSPVYPTTTIYQQAVPYHVAPYAPAYRHDYRGGWDGRGDNRDNRNNRYHRDSRDNSDNRGNEYHRQSDPNSSRRMNAPQHRIETDRNMPSPPRGSAPRPNMGSNNPSLSRQER